MDNKYQIENDQDLRNHYHSIHNLIRNKFSQFGKNALAIFNFFYALKLIEPLIENKQIELSDYCRFSKMKRFQGDELIIYVKEAVKEIFYSKDQGLRNAIFVNLPFDNFNARDDTLGEVIRRIDAIDINKFDVAGRNYEYFLGFITKKNKGSKAGSQIDDLGQYFSSRLLCKYSIAKAKPTLKADGSVPSMMDPFCGSGGFITEYIRYFKYFHPDIDWNQEIKNICGYDADDSIVKSTRVELMSLTHTIPYKLDSDRNIKDSNIQWSNSFQHTFDRKTDFHITNFPYGGDKGKDKEDKVLLIHAGKEIKHVAKTGSINIKEPEDILKTNKQQGLHLSNAIITGDNKENLAMLLGMGTLNPNGTYIGIVKQGVFSDPKFKDLRRALINNYNIEWVVSVPMDDFWNTDVNTCVIIYRNNGKTEKVKFCQIQKIAGEPNRLHEVNPKTKQIISTFNGDDYSFTKGDGEYIEVTYDELVKEIVYTENQTSVDKKTGKEVTVEKTKKSQLYSLFYKNYIIEELSHIKDFDVLRIRDACEINPKRVIPQYEEYYYVEIGDIENNKIVNYTLLNKSSLPTGSKRIIRPNDILVCSVRPNSQKVVFVEEKNLRNNLLISGAITILYPKTPEIGRYLYHYITRVLDKKLQFRSDGSQYPSIGDDDLGNILFRLPQDGTVLGDTLQYLDSTEEYIHQIENLQKTLKIKEKSISNLINILTRKGEKGVDWDEKKVFEIASVIDGKKFYKSERDIDNYYKPGENLPLLKNKGGKIDEYVPINDKYSCSTVVRGDLLISLVGTCGRLTFVEVDKAYHINNMARFENIKINKMYFYFALLGVLNSIDFKTTDGYSTVGCLKIADVRQLTIRIPKPHVMEKYNLEKEFEFVDNLRTSIQQMLKEQEQLTKDMMRLVLDD